MYPSYVILLCGFGLSLKALLSSYFIVQCIFPGYGNEKTKKTKPRTQPNQEIPRQALYICI